MKMTSLTIATSVKDCPKTNRVIQNYQFQEPQQEFQKENPKEEIKFKKPINRFTILTTVKKDFSLLTSTKQNMS